jgi:Domain of unknown function (DUF4136)
MRAFRVLVLASLLTCGCVSSPPQPYSMQDPQANFGAFKTFGWDTGQAPEVPGEPLTIVNSQIRTAIASELQRKGYAEPAAGAKPDLLLRYETAAAEKTKSSPIRIGVGMGGYGSNGGAGVGVSSSGMKEVKEGTLVLRVIDPARNAEVWNGRVSRELGKGGVPNEALIQSAVGDLLREFPGPGAAPK